jgi:hypothetical protein
MPEMLSSYYDSALSRSLALTVSSINCIARAAVPFGWVMSLLVLLHRPARTRISPRYCYVRWIGLDLRFVISLFFRQCSSLTRRPLLRIILPALTPGD